MTGLLKRAREFHRAKDFVHGVSHLRRTREYARMLAHKEHADMRIVDLGAMLHQLHDGKLALQWLKDAGVGEKTAKRVVECVACCHPDAIHEAKSIEAKVVYDADKLQWLGFAGFFRELFCNMTARKQPFSIAWNNANKIEAESAARLQTRTGQKIGMRRHRRFRLFMETLHIH
ncbi:hypothetical protein HY492_03530 [Candidatus Woesearchaeota archaeon]|nr:hypothetical protein [Candidatus Woesearchaeota archaeon]